MPRSSYGRKDGSGRSGKESGRSRTNRSRHPTIRKKVKKLPRLRYGRRDRREKESGRRSRYQQKRMPRSRYRSRRESSRGRYPTIKRKWKKLPRVGGNGRRVRRSRIIVKKR